MCIFFKITTILTQENTYKESEYYEIINNIHKIRRGNELFSKE